MYVKIHFLLSLPVRSSQAATNGSTEIILELFVKLSENWFKSSFTFIPFDVYSTESRRVCMDLHCCSIDFRFSSLRQSFFYREVKLWKCNLWIKSEAKASSFSTFYEVLKGALRDLQGTSLKVSLFLCDR